MKYNIDEVVQIKPKGLSNTLSDGTEQEYYLGYVLAMNTHDSTPNYLIKVDNWSHGHNGGFERANEYSVCGKNKCWWVYEHHLEKIDPIDTESIFDQLNEYYQRENQIIPEAGDTLYCHTSSQDGIKFVKGYSYTVRGVDHYQLRIMSNDGRAHNYTLQPDYQGRSWLDWFTPFKLDMEAIFNQINESDIGYREYKDFTYLKNVDMTGMMFFQPLEYKEMGIVYLITLDDDENLNIVWEDSTGSIPKEGLIIQLKSGFYILKDEKIETDMEKIFNDL